MYVSKYYFLFAHSIFTTPQDCWSLSNRHPSTNELVPDPYKFPRGIKALADDIHALGLKIGIYRQIVLAVQMFWCSNREYSDAGTNTCAGYPGSLGYEATDAATWESWDIDCELHDYCNPRVMFFRSLRYTDQT
jgi:alpha-galactosidase